MIIYEKQLWFVTGKGGVGKSSVAAGLAHQLSQSAKKTLLVETHSNHEQSQIFGQQATSYQFQRVNPYLDLFQINVESAFKEYVLRQIKFKLLYKAIFENDIVKNFMRATPGLNELLIVGKIWDLCNKCDYDHIIVDAPASGHAMAMLQIPQIVCDAVKIGPLKNQAQRVREFLYDPKKTAYILVTLCEEMPVTESLELSKKINSLGLNFDLVVRNQIWPRFSTNAKIDTQTNPEILEHYIERMRLQSEYQKKLDQEFTQEQIDIELVYQSNNLKIIAEQISRQIPHHRN